MLLNYIRCSKINGMDSQLHSPNYSLEYKYIQNKTNISFILVIYDYNKSIYLKFFKAKAK